MAGFLGHRNGEAGVSRNLESRTRRIDIVRLGSIQLDIGGSLDDFHPLGLGRSEVIAPGQDDPNGLVFAAGGDDGVRNDPALEIDVGLGVNGGVGEFHPWVIVAGNRICKCKPP